MREIEEKRDLFLVVDFYFIGVIFFFIFFLLVLMMESNLVKNRYSKDNQPRGQHAHYGDD